MAETKLPISNSETANGMSDADILRSFVENEIVETNPDGMLVKQSAFTKLSDPNAAYYVLAERGIGKTQVLRFLKLNLEKRGDTILSITLDSPIYNRFLSLKNESLIKEVNAEVDDMWKLAIFEQMWIELSKRYLVNKSFYFWQFAHKSNFRKSLGITSRIMRYIRSQRPNDFEDVKKIWFDQASASNALQRFLNFILGNKRRFSVTTSTPQVTKVEYEGELDGSTTDLSTPVIDQLTALSLLEKDIWNTLRYLQTLKPHFSYKSQEINLFPPSPAVYVIADGLDQDEDLDLKTSETKKIIGGPIIKDDLFALIVLTKHLNENTGDFSLGDKKNFKLITSMRAISFFGAAPGEKSLRDRMGDLVQVTSKFESLNWAPSAIKRMILRRMLNGENILPIKDLDKELNTKVPPLYFWGRSFNPGVNFLIEFSGGKVRSLIRLWEMCAEVTEYQKHNPFQKKLGGSELVAGLQNYSSTVLSAEIGREYAQEYPGVDSLLAYLHFKHNQISRVIPKNELSRLIRSYIKSKQELPDWLSVQNTNLIMKSLFDMGIVGIPYDGIPLDADWPMAEYKSYKIEEKMKVSDEGEKLRFDSVKFLVINPAFWYYLTNISSEIEQRRKYISILYDQLTKSTLQLSDELLSIRKTGNETQFGVSLGKFLIVCNMIKSFSGSPEPIDWEIWQSVTDGIKASEQKLEIALFGKQSGDLSMLAEAYSHHVSKKPTLNDFTIIFDEEKFPKVKEHIKAFPKFDTKRVEELIRELYGEKDDGIPLNTLISQSLEKLEALGVKIGGFNA